uniref:Peptidase M14 domain-containing protein n=1 Tax=Timema douglasi TaxID=61478 RepID=A0A7R8Z4G6_TIMDO|nr:unnamed protein product [Timema douglasi]
MCIYSWLNSLSLTNPGIVTPIVAGTTYEGRQIRGVKISYKSNNPGVFIEAGMHAREWIGPATATYILNELLTSNDPNIRYIAQNFDWYIVPSANPDGYEYTHTTNRLWRKTRSGGPVCHGVDPNRNFGFHWMEGGASSNSCLETHAGQSAFSEVETRSMAWYIWSISRKIQVYIAFHSYSQLLLIPYGIDSERVSNYQQLLRIGHKMAASLARRYGTRYTVGNIVDILYVVSGSSVDWVKGSIGVPFTYTYELRDQGRYGFLLPANHIIPTGQETLDSIVTLLHETRLSPGEPTLCKVSNMFHVGIHACEWIGPATVLYILNELLTSNNTEIRDIAENFDWYIDRLWRKTRSEYNATCYGVDPNRNWDFHWGEVGTSPDPCNRMYAGPGPLSEVEIRGLSQYITSVAERLDVYISLHSYGQLLMFPYGFTEDPVDNYDTLSNIAEKAANSLTSVHGTVYKSGPIISTVYPASGSSLDWVKGVLNVTFTFAFELRDNGTYGDLLPANLIIPSGEETLASVITILQQARDL